MTCGLAGQTQIARSFELLTIHSTTRDWLKPFVKPARRIPSGVIFLGGAVLPNTITSAIVTRLAPRISMIRRCLDMRVYAVYAQRSSGPTGWQIRPLIVTNTKTTPNQASVKITLREASSVARLVRHPGLSQPAIWTEGNEDNLECLGSAFSLPSVPGPTGDRRENGEPEIPLWPPLPPVETGTRVSRHSCRTTSGATWIPPDSNQSPRSHFTTKSHAGSRLARTPGSPFSFLRRFARCGILVTGRIKRDHPGSKCGPFWWFIIPHRGFG